MAWSDYSHSDCIAVLNAFKVQNPRLLITFTFQVQEVISCDNFCMGLCFKLGSDCLTIYIFFSIFRSGACWRGEKDSPECVKAFLLITHVKRCEIWLRTFMIAFNKIWSTVGIRSSLVGKSIESLLSKVQWQQQQEPHQTKDLTSRTRPVHMLSFAWRLTRLHFLAFLCKTTTWND